MEDAKRESVLTVLSLSIVFVTLLCENFLAHLPAFKEEEFKAEHPQLAAAVDQLPNVIFGDRAPTTVQKHAGLLADGPIGRRSMGWHLCLPIQLESLSSCYEIHELQMVGLIALGFRDFFRWNDLSSLRIDDVQIGD